MGRVFYALGSSLVCQRRRVLNIVCRRCLIQLLEDDEKHMRAFRHMMGSPPVRDVTAFEISERLAGPFQLHQRGTDSGSSVPRLSAHCLLYTSDAADDMQ